jgi:hypothetical protein
VIAGKMNSCVRDGFMVVGDEIIESAMSWRSRRFENQSYKKLFTDYWRRGANWTCAPYPTMSDELYDKVVHLNTSLLYNVLKNNYDIFISTRITHLMMTRLE